MSGINFMGSYSGIDMSTIDQLMEAERAKGTQFTNKKENIQREQNAWKDINTRLDSLFQKLDTLTQTDTFESRTVSSSVGESTSLEVTTGENAAEGQYRVQVEQLAESTRLTGQQLDIGSIYDAFGVSGNLSFTVDGVEEGTEETFTIEILEEDSLKDITAKINEVTNESEEESSVQASIIDNRIVLTDTNMGDRSLSVSGDVVTQLGIDETQREVERGQAAEFTVDGLLITRDTNSIDDAIEGVTFNLKNIHQGEESEVITISSDIEKTTEAVENFVEQYNSVMRFIDDQLDVGDPTLEENTTGALTGDGTLMRLQSNLRSLMTRNLAGDFSGDFNSIEDLGITVDRYGAATLDTETFQNAMQEDPANVARFFYQEEVVTETVTEDGEEVSQSKLEKQGLSELMKNFIDTYISDSSGIITNKNESYDRMIKDIDEQIETFNARLDRKRDRYVQQFTALDVAMMQAESQMNYMASQLGMNQQQ